MDSKKTTVIAHPNLAFVKYWGKRDEDLRLPAGGSISMTLGGLDVRTTVEFGVVDGDGVEDDIVIGGAPATGSARSRAVRFLDRVRERAGIEDRARVVSESNFPAAAGLASSAAGFAALALAGTRAAGLDLDARALSILARLGSGSACRSIEGGFVEWEKGAAPDGSDSVGVQVAGPGDWPDLRIAAAVVEGVAKPCGSTEGMRRTAETSPFYAPWLDVVEADLGVARSAIRSADLDGLGRVAETNALRMHAVALGADPPILYWAPGTIAVIRKVGELRAAGTPAWLSIDAGPNVFVLTTEASAGDVVGALEALEPVQRVVCCEPGEGARMVDEHLF